MGEGGPTTYTTHRNDNGTVSSWINQFNSNVRSYGAIGFADDSSLFNGGNIGDSYYVYAKTSSSATLGGEYATLHHWFIQRVDIYLDEQTQGDTQAAYYYDISKDMYYAADRRTVISKDEALANVSSYQSQGYTLRKETKGLSLVSVIKDGVVDEIFENPNKESNLVFAAMCNSFAWVNEILVGGANPNIQDEEGWTALMHAVWSENAEIVRLLLNAGANPNLQEYAYGGTALDMAEMKGNAEIIRMLSQ